MCERGRTAIPGEGACQSRGEVGRRVIFGNTEGSRVERCGSAVDLEGPEWSEV